METIWTRRCILSALSEADFPELVPLFTDTEVRRYLGGVRSLSDALEHLSDLLQAPNVHTFPVRLISSGELIGVVTVAPHHNPKDMEISYMFLPEFWGRGYARETVRAMLIFCGRELQLTRVVSEIQAANARSRHLLECLGYRNLNELPRFDEPQVIYARDLTKPIPQSWPDCDSSVFQYITGFVELLKEKLGDHLAGVYLHGSLAMGSYFPPKSDMDFIIVTDRPIDVDLAKELGLSIARYAEKRPTTGNIECSVITCETAKTVPDEMPYELHYSETMHQRILDDKIVYGLHEADPDLQAHLMCVKKRGVSLFGKTIGEVFGKVSWRSFMLAVLEDFDWIVADENICESPVYGILNICRVLQALFENGQKYLSKFEGAMWGIKSLPGEFAPLIEKALDVYCSDALVNEEERRTGGMDWDKASLLAFRDYARDKAVLKTIYNL